MSNDVEQAAQSTRGGSRLAVLRSLATLLGDVCKSLLQSPKSEDWRRPWGEREITSTRPGYPLYSSWLALHPEYQNFRRFRTSRMRLLLAKQDAVSQLEVELRDLDRNEEAELFLGSMRLDRNAVRQSVLQKLDAAFKDYDDFLLRSTQILRMPETRFEDLVATDVWLNSTGCISRTESAYLKAENWDLVNLCGIGESVSRDHSLLTTRVTQAIGQLRAGMRRRDSYSVTVMNVPVGHVRIVLKLLTALTSIVLLLTPMAALNVVHSNGLRFLVIFFSTSIFVSILIFATPARLLETLAASAAYAAVLAVFVSGSTTPGSAKQ
ncbi:hypothetical protein BCR34DRAFT_557864 [Clohesyomyces aquaticus]|uniref:DUF6594 domain-containing protein n=1 Tax=Clohesyomyces aquaticus TaxID=1231657 RepID=A0A1Y2A091_9PLEO|nr:hypothetical protein BCR34DRAFT_557864 [Clohesyomyces aquaticus]